MSIKTLLEQSKFAPVIEEEPPIVLINTNYTATCHPNEKHHAKGLCKPCYHRNYRSANPTNKDRTRIYNWANQGIKDFTLRDYELMHKAQRGRCAICEEISSDGRMLSVDHDHNTGKVRALLCNLCNSRLMCNRHTVELFEKAIIYLNKYGSK